MQCSCHVVAVLARPGAILGRSTWCVDTLRPFTCAYPRRGFFRRDSGKTASSSRFCSYELSELGLRKFRKNSRNVSCSHAQTYLTPTIPVLAVHDRVRWTLLRRALFQPASPGCRIPQALTLKRVSVSQASPFLPAVHAPPSPIPARCRNARPGHSASYQAFTQAQAPTSP